jgi:hypothetical protein
MPFSLNLILAFVWLVIGLPLAIVNLTGKEIAGIEPGQQGLYVAVLALVLAAYNFARWGASRAYANRTRKPPPVKKKPVEGQRFEYNPEFDFNRPGPVTLPNDEEPQQK